AHKAANTHLREMDSIVDAHFEKRMNDYHRYRASFSPEQLQAPAVWADPTGEKKKQVDTRIRELHQLSTTEQKQLDDWARDERNLERQAQVAAVAKNTTEATRLRSDANDLRNKARDLRTAHEEKVAPEIQDLLEEYQLVNLKPGDKDEAMSVKPDPTFPD